MGSGEPLHAHLRSDVKPPLRECACRSLHWCEYAWILLIDTGPSTGTDITEQKSSPVDHVRLPDAQLRGSVGQGYNDWHSVASLALPPRTHKKTLPCYFLRSRTPPPPSLPCLHRRKRNRLKHTRKNASPSSRPCPGKQPWHPHEHRAALNTLGCRSLSEIRAAIPAHCHVRQTWKGLLYLARDLALAALAWKLALHIDPTFRSSYVTHRLTPLVAEVARWGAWLT